MDLEFQNPKFNILWKIAFIYFFNKTLTLWSSKVNKAIRKLVKIAEEDHGYMLQFFKKLELIIYTKLVPETVHYIKFHIKICWQSCMSIYHVLFNIYNLFTILYLE